MNKSLCHNHFMSRSFKKIQLHGQFCTLYCFLWVTFFTQSFSLHPVFSTAFFHYLYMLPHFCSPFFLPLFSLYFAFCVSEAWASQWHKPCSCKTNNDWDLCGLSILSPFQRKTLRMEREEGTGRRKKVQWQGRGWDGVRQARGRRGCPSLRGRHFERYMKKEGKMERERDREAPFSLKHTTCFHSLWVNATEIPLHPLQTYLTDMQAWTCLLNQVGSSIKCTCTSCSWEESGM